MCRESEEEPIRVPHSNGTVRQYKRACSPISQEAGQFRYVILYVIKSQKPNLVLGSIPFIRGPLASLTTTTDPLIWWRKLEYNLRNLKPLIRNNISGSYYTLYLARVCEACACICVGSCTDIVIFTYFVRV